MYILFYFMIDIFWPLKVKIPLSKFPVWTLKFLIKKSQTGNPAQGILKLIRCCPLNFFLFLVFLKNFIFTYRLHILAIEEFWKCNFFVVKNIQSDIDAISEKLGFFLIIIFSFKLTFKVVTNFWSTRYFKGRYELGVNC